MTRRYIIAAFMTALAFLFSPSAAAQTAHPANPYTIKYDDDHCTFGLDETHPEARLYLQDSDLINRSFVLEAVAQDVPAFGPLVAQNPQLENKISTDSNYKKAWLKAVEKLKAAGYTDNDIMWLDAITFKRGVRELDEEIAYPLTPQEAKFKVDSQSRATVMHYAAKKFGSNNLGGEIMLSQYWHKSPPYPELSEKITKPANAGYDELVERARNFAGYRYDAMVECSKKGTVVSVNPLLRKDPFNMVYKITSQVSTVLMPAF